MSKRRIKLFFALFFNTKETVLSMVTLIKSFSLNLKSLMFLVLQKPKTSYLFKSLCHLKKEKS